MIKTTVEDAERIGEPPANDAVTDFYRPVTAVLVSRTFCPQFPTSAWKQLNNSQRK